MEHLNFLENAKSELKIADHMLYITIPLLSEKMLINSVIDHLYKSMLNCMLARLEYEKYYKKIFSLPKEEESIIDLFFERNREMFEKEMELSKNLKEFIQLHDLAKKSRIELKNKNELLVISDTFEMIRVDEAKIKSYCESIKKLLMIIEGEIGGK